ncbi:uncharacterized protein LOC126176283 [Schistocerca cancellata]|uniref:uncharacterized protein LOC126176283 n=1 Tax=Schistocerca cancellata TaxID=274614 RepID=UPI00211961EA|nr:uncharacterized protein LOC126176283 [Schistocerca cancellata]
MTPGRRGASRLRAVSATRSSTPQAPVRDRRCVYQLVGSDMRFSPVASALVVLMVSGWVEPHRSKRVVYLDTASPIDVALQITVPFGVALPSVRKKHGSEEADKAGSGRRSDSASPLHQLFALLQVEPDACRLRLLCHLAADPQYYFPVADIFSEQMRKETEAQYVSAWLQGAATASEPWCASSHPGCATPPDGFLDARVMALWRAASRFVRIRFRSAD